MLVAENLNPIMIGSELTEFAEILKKNYIYMLSKFLWPDSKMLSQNFNIRVTTRLEDFFNKYFNTIFLGVDLENAFIQ